MQRIIIPGEILNTQIDQPTSQRYNKTVRLLFTQQGPFGMSVRGFNLSSFLKYHPSIQFPEDMRNICQPLSKLGIDYFSHIHIDSNNNLTANSSHPGLFGYYFEHSLQNADLHSVEASTLQRYTFWDRVELHGKAEELYQAARLFGFTYTFTIFEQDQNGKNYYNFAVHPSKDYINQFYFQYIDLLEQYIAYYKYSLQINDRLNRAYNMPCPLNQYEGGYNLGSTSSCLLPAETISDYLSCIKSPAPRAINIKDIPRRESQCALFLLEGMSAKEIATNLNISARTVEVYLTRLKNRFDCKNNIQLSRCLIEAGFIAQYQK